MVRSFNFFIQSSLFLVFDAIISLKYLLVGQLRTGYFHIDARYKNGLQSRTTMQVCPSSLDSSKQYFSFLKLSLKTNTNLFTTVCNGTAIKMIMFLLQVLLYCFIFSRFMLTEIVAR